MTTPDEPLRDWTPTPSTDLGLENLLDITGGGRLKAHVHYTPFDYHGRTPRGLKTLSPRALTDFIIALACGNEPNALAACWDLEPSEAFEFVQPTSGMYGVTVPHPQDEDRAFPLSPVNVTIMNLHGTPGYEEYRNAARPAIEAVAAIAYEQDRPYQDVLDDPPDAIRPLVDAAARAFEGVG